MLGMRLALCLFPHPPDHSPTAHHRGLAACVCQEARHTEGHTEWAHRDAAPRDSRSTGALVPVAWGTAETPVPSKSCFLSFVQCSPSPHRSSQGWRVSPGGGFSQLPTLRVSPCPVVPLLEVLGHAPTKSASAIVSVATGHQKHREGPWVAVRWACESAS